MVKYKLITSRLEPPEKVQRILEEAAENNSLAFKIKPKTLRVHGMFMLFMASSAVAQG